jgi:dethiobiotin synthetase
LKLFITGTGTGIGKTWVSAALIAQALNLGKSVAYYKPIQTGSPPNQPPEDPQFIADIFKTDVKIYNRYCFEPPVTPSVADLTGIIDLEQIHQDVYDYAQQSDILLIEGAGGLAVPINPQTLMIDLIQSLAVPVLLVAHSQLGTINHTLLSVEALLSRKIPIYGIVLNYYPEDPTQAELAVQTLLPTLRNHLPKDLPLWTCIQASLNGTGSGAFRLNCILL